MIVTCALIIPSVVTVGLSETLVNRTHWLSGFTFNKFLFTAMICNCAGLLVALVAFLLGKYSSGIVFLLHLVTLYCLPAFFYG
jgi:chromate transport protein ChrA